MEQLPNALADAFAQLQAQVTSNAVLFDASALAYPAWINQNATNLPEFSRTLLQMASSTQRYEAEAASQNAVIVQLQERIQKQLEAATSAAEAAAEQLAMKDAALDDRDEQIAALNAKLATSEQSRAGLEAALQQAQQSHTASRKRQRAGSINAHGRLVNV
jgi:predicted RNase H-like nuclease (RuvC/YqgF family)